MGLYMRGEGVRCLGPSFVCTARLHGPCMHGHWSLEQSETSIICITLATARPAPPRCISAPVSTRPRPRHAPFRKTPPTGSACSSGFRSATSSPPPRPSGRATTSLSTALSPVPAHPARHSPSPLLPSLPANTLYPLPGPYISLRGETSNTLPLIAT